MINGISRAAATKDSIGLGNVTNDAQIPLAQKGAASGVASLDSASKVVEGGWNSGIADLGYSGELSNVASTNGEADTLLAGEIVYLVLDTTLKWKRTDADTEATCDKVCGIVIADVLTGATCVNKILLRGFYRNDTLFNLTVGGLLYLSATAGGLTQTAPSGSGQTVRVVGQAVTADVIYFNPDNTWIVRV